MKKRIAYSMGVVAVLCAVGGAGAEAPRGTAEAYVAEAIEANPMLRSHRDHVDAARAAARTQGVLPDPVLGIGYFIETPETRVGPQRSAVMLSQRIPIGKLGLEREIATKAADVGEQDYRRALIDLRYAVKSSFYEWFAVNRVTSVLEEEHGVLRRMEEIARVRYASGLDRQQDALKAQLSLSQIEDEFAVVERRRVSVESALRALLDRGADEPMAEPVYVPAAVVLPTLAELTSVALENRPEIVTAGIQMERAAAARSLARRTYVPDLTIGAQYVQVDERDGMEIPDNGKDVFQVNAAINIPLWIGKRRAAVAQAGAEEARARNQQSSWRTRVENEVKDAYERVRVAEERVALYRDAIVPQAEQAFGASEAAYQTGEIDFLNLLDSERMLLSARKKYYEVMADYGIQLATLEQRLGVALEEVR